MNQLQTDEKTAIHTALESIHADDHHSFARSPNPAVRSRSVPTSSPSRPRPIAVQPSPSRRPKSFQAAVQPFPSPGSESLQAQTPELLPDLQAAIQTALQNGFPGQTNPPLERSSQPSGSPAAKPSSPATRDPLKELEAQADRINQLSREREAAFQRAQAIAAQIEQERRATRRPVELSLPLEPSMIRPQAERSHPGIPRSLNSPESVTLRIQVPPSAQETAAEVAQLLRQIQGHRDYSDKLSQQAVPVRRSRKRPSLLRRLRRWLFASSPGRSSSRRHHIKHTDPNHTDPNHTDPNYIDSSRADSNCTDASLSSSPEAIAPTEPVFTLQETLTLLVGAVLTRLLLNLLLEALPLLTVPVMILLILPAAIALYKATIAPQSGILWGYRICVILFGLLMGGRL
ncbi:hypothetical protein [Leptolyngbya ohadii]|uniref:hypothetical protein n=1 Tax=Leptolyngbya ohadii TaxID=1962290 RepID=UPI000B59D037|nr:hypothetical protein [Leptolyngbya ohadii]